MAKIPSQISLEFRLRSLALLLALGTTAAVVVAGINFSQRARYVRPYDGIEWEEGEEGVYAALKMLGTPGDRAGIRAGDVLVAINGNFVEQPIDVTKQLFRAQAGSELRYDLLRNGKPFSTTVVAVPGADPFSLRGFLEFAGLLYLGIGLFVLLKRWNASHALHFYLFCLMSFVFYSFSYSGKFNNFDWVVYWSDVAAGLLQPALFLHFALAFPVAKPWFRERRGLFALLYLPAALILLAHGLVVGTSLLPPSLQALELFERIEFTHLAILFLVAAAVLEYTYRHSSDPTLTQQMKWVTRGTWLGILPFTTFYVLPFFLGFEPSEWMKLSTLSLILIPLTFGYAIVRYRLMDVDIIFRRGMAYTLATATIAGIYFGLAVAVAQLFHVNFGSGGVVVAIIVAAILFQPIKDWTQLQLDRLIYRERFDYRRTLEEFGRELSSEIHLPQLLAKLLDRLGRTLPVARVDILLEEGGQPGSFRLARSRERRDEPALDRIQLPEEAGDYLFFDSAQPVPFLREADRRTLEELGLHYLIACRVKNHTIAFLAVGKTAAGSYLTSEDMQLLRTLAGYLAIALENARLVESETQKVEQIARLKEFGENILESASVGLVAVDPEDRIDSWNGPMESLFGRPRHQVLGRSLAEVFPPALLRELDSRKGEDRLTSLYKFYLDCPSGRRVVTNIAVAPLVSREKKPIGRLLIFDDITERTQFEAQLLQAEKLSSIGLLAAGVAHEVNTPLAVISNYAQMLAKQLSTEDTRASLVDKIIKQTFRASEIISSLLNFSRTGPAEFGHVDVNRAVRETLALVEPQLRSSQVRIETHLADDLPPVHGDAGKLQQVFLNFFFNARDAMPNGGRLRVHTRAQDGRVQVEISDTGVGISREHMSKIYDPFFTTKTTGRGTGLGLAVTYGIMQEHNGSIHVSSNPGHGTTFVLEFPLRETMPAVAAVQEKADG